MSQPISLLNFPSQEFKQTRSHWGPLNLSEQALAIAQQAQQSPGLVVVISPDTAHANELYDLLKFFAPKPLRLMLFPEWETLPYDRFSPHQDIVSERIRTLYHLPATQQGILVVSVNTLLQKIAPANYIQQHTLLLKAGQTIEVEDFVIQLEAAGYQRVNQVMEHGEFAIRGALIDLFPMGSKQPFRLDLFDNEIETIRRFDAETQRSIEQIEQIELLPAKEYDFTENGIAQFRQAFRDEFGADARNCEVYKQVSDGQNVGGLEYYLPLFHADSATLFDYLPAQTLFFDTEGLDAAIEHNWHDFNERYEIGKHNPDFPILAPEKLILRAEDAFEKLKHFHRVTLHTEGEGKRFNARFNTLPLNDLTVQANSEYPLAKLNAFIDRYKGRIAFCAETLGRRETLMTLLGKHKIHAQPYESWAELINSDSNTQSPGLVIGPLQQSIHTADFTLIAESALLGQTVVQKRRRKAKHNEFDQAISHLVELEVGSPIVHIDHGVGRYLGLERIPIHGEEREFLMIEYAGQDKLYVPVTSLHLISRYTGASAETAPIHKLGTDKWDKAKRKAAEKVRDVAAELLDIYAQREAKTGHAYSLAQDAYSEFCSGFPFEETEDQLQTIHAVLSDMQNPKPMDRLVCGDVGFGKTEVAMRAAFVAAYGGKQVSVLVPTTLLAQQHFESFKDRFANWPVRIEVLSRFQTGKQQAEILQDLADNKVDIIIGTHKLIQQDVKFANLGLMIIDEEHRFGVRQKEQLKKLRAEVDVLTMTATPIPRTLNMAMNDLRDLSIIATPPAKRLAVQTFVQEWNKDTVREACLRELRRGGQVYLLFNQVDRIEHMAEEIHALVPEARVAVAHGQMHERELEKVMQDFYHRRFNILVCTTIIETGIDVPTANTIIIHRADKFGLAQLHQLRGRVGRSHHRAYAYLFTGDKAAITDDARKRLDAIAKHDTLGAGFMLASHDLEIRGAGELLGEGQSGQIHEVGFGLYSELLDRAVKALKSGKQPELDTSLQAHCEVDLGFAALIPEDYLPDIHSRLVLYKRIASADGEQALHELEVEMIDRFGLLPPQVKNLFSVTRIKLVAEPIGVKKIDASEQEVRIQFSAQPNIDPAKLIQLIQRHPKRYQLKGQTELKVFDTMPDMDSRCQVVQFTLDAISVDSQ
jgi:transcription-repair coupling factor (superfamily II helicase)